MINKAAGIGFLALQTLGFAAVSALMVAGVAQKVDPMVERSVPFFVQTLANLVFSIVLFLNRKKVGSMVFRFVFILLLATSLQNIRLFSLYSFYSHRAPSFQIASTAVFLFASMLTALMFCGLSIIPQAKSLITVNNYIALAIFASLSFLVFGPRVVNLEHLRTVGIYRLLVMILYVCAFLSFLIDLLIRPRGGDMTTRLSRGVLLVGSFFLTVFPYKIINYLGAAFFIAGEIGFSFVLLSKPGALAAADITDRMDQAEDEDVPS